MVGSPSAHCETESFAPEPLALLATAYVPLEDSVISTVQVIPPALPFARTASRRSEVVSELIGTIL